jgi:hypothetical protein
MLSGIQQKEVPEERVSCQRVCVAASLSTIRGSGTLAHLTASGADRRYPSFLDELGIAGPSTGWTQLRHVFGWHVIEAADHYSGINLVTFTDTSEEVDRRYQDENAETVSVPRVMKVSSSA